MPQPKGTRSGHIQTLEDAVGGVPFIDDYLPYLLAKASHQISSEFHAEVRAAGLSVMEWRVLASLSHGGSLTVGALCGCCLAQQPTVTKLIARMVTKGWVVRVDSDEDRRHTWVHLSALGQSIVDPLVASAREHEARVLTALTGPAQARLKASLRDLIR